jgi:hypothetical protein
MGATVVATCSVVQFATVSVAGAATPTTPPSISFTPNSVEVNTAPRSCSATNITPPPATLGGDPSPTVTYSPSLSGPFGLGTTQVTATADNGEPSVATATFSVTVVDREPPQLLGLPRKTIQVATTDPSGMAVTFDEPTVDDNCPNARVFQHQGPSSGDDFPIGATEVGFTAEDGSGNIVQEYFTVVVELLTAPTFTEQFLYQDWPTDPGRCYATDPPVRTPSVAGNPTPTVTFTSLPTGQVALGIHVVTITASNGVDPEATQQIRLDIVDRERPVLIMPANITVAATGPSGARVDYRQPDATDNCSSVGISQESSLGSGSIFPIGVTDVTYSASDGAGNRVVDSFTVTVTSPPVLNVPTEIEVAVDATCQVRNVGGFTPGLGGFPTPTVTYSPSLAGPFPLGSTTITATASNGVSPDMSLPLILTAVDRTPPTITVPGDITVTATGPNGAVVNHGRILAFDACVGPTITRIAGLASGSVFPVGTTIVTYRATDSAGNHVEGSFNVTVVPVGPTIAPMADVTVDGGRTCSASNVAVVAPTVTGTPTPTVSYSPSLAGPFPLGATTVTATASNGGTPATTTFKVIVTDTTVPKLVVSGDITLPASGPTGRPVNYLVPRASDNCGAPTITPTAGLASGAVFPIGTTTVTYKAVDASNNSTTASFKVTITAEAPTIAPITNIVVDNTVDLCSARVSRPAVTMTGKPAPTVSFAPTLPGSFPVGATTVTATASNGVSPDATSTFTVTVRDTQAPKVTALPNITVAATRAAGAVVTYGAVPANDNCPGMTLVRTAGLARGATFPIGTTMVSFKATDASSNTAEMSFTVTVVGAADQLAALRSSVAGTSLPGPLVEELDEARVELIAKRPAGVCEELEEFIVLARAQVNRQLTSAQVNSFVLAARQIERVVGCTTA